jgi:hypothetical protein
MCRQHAVVEEYADAAGTVQSCFDAFSQNVKIAGGDLQRHFTAHRSLPVLARNGS